jgi:hypothetical protein
MALDADRNAAAPELRLFALDRPALRAPATNLATAS